MVNNISWGCFSLMVLFTCEGLRFQALGSGTANSYISYIMGYNWREQGGFPKIATAKLVCNYRIYIYIWIYGGMTMINLFFNFQQILPEAHLVSLARGWYIILHQSGWTYNGSMMFNEIDRQIHRQKVPWKTRNRIVPDIWTLRKWRKGAPPSHGCNRPREWQ